MLRDAYREAIARHGFERDCAQEAVVRRLDDTARALQQAGPVRRGLVNWINPRPAIAGLYLWGGVGRGKTFLMDLFFATLPFPDKERLHFHRFMRHVHGQLKRHAGPDPVPALGREFSRRARVLCFDEFYVSDIGDAMILGGALRALFDAGVTVVATSNIAPDDLYLNGLQRARFLPAIEAIKQHMAVVTLETGKDYRLRALERADLYHWPLDARASAGLRRAFAELAAGEDVAANPIVVNGREVPVVRRADGVAWFTFDALCTGPRAAADYIEIAAEHHSLLIEGVPRMDDERNEAARRFIALVDECYERRVKLIVTAAVPVERLYSGRRLAGAFQRTRSRLSEMRSRAYLARAHKGG